MLIVEKEKEGCSEGVGIGAEEKKTLFFCGKMRKNREEVGKVWIKKCMIII